MIKRGIYCIYNSIEYSFDKVIGDKVLITSYDRNDLNNGFVCNLNENFIKKYGFYCQKEVLKSEITEAYEITPYANYKGFTFDVYGPNENRKLRLVTQQWLSNYSESECKIRDSLVEIGFYVREVDKCGCTYEKYVSIDDPDVEVFEERTEIDISKL